MCVNMPHSPPVLGVEIAKFDINFDVQDLAYFDESTMSWKVESGEYEILIGSSSRDIQESVKITIK